MSNIYNTTIAYPCSLNKIDLNSDATPIQTIKYALDLFKDFNNIETVEILKEWEDDHLPCFDILINKKYLAQVTHLCREAACEMDKLYADKSRECLQSVWDEIIYEQLEYSIQDNLEYLEYGLLDMRFRHKVYQTLNSYTNYKDIHFGINFDDFKRITSNFINPKTGYIYTVPVHIIFNDIFDKDVVITINNKYHALLVNHIKKYVFEKDEKSKTYILDYLKFQIQSGKDITDKDDFDKEARRIKELEKQIVSQLDRQYYNIRSKILDDNDNTHDTLHKEVSLMLQLQTGLTVDEYKFFYKHSEITFDNIFKVNLNNIPKKDFQIYNLS